jgi:hypothetical protein
MIDTDRYLHDAARRDFENREGEEPEDQDATIRELGAMFRSAYPGRSEHYCTRVAWEVLTSIDAAVRESNLASAIVAHLTEDERTKLAPIVYLYARLRSEVSDRIEEMTRGR